MPQAAALNQAVEIFSQVCGMVTGALQSLRHQYHVKAGGISLRRVFGEVLLEQGMADAVDVLIHLQNFPSALQIKFQEPAINQIKHLAQNCRHFPSCRTSDAAIFAVRDCTRSATLIIRSPIRSRSVVHFRLVSNWRARASFTRVMAAGKRSSM
jgi:hypothetical protein